MFFDNLADNFIVRPKVKICGVRNIDAALWAMDAGVDAIGLMFYEPSPRSVTLERAKEIITAVAGQMDTIGVFVNPSVQEVARTIEKTGLSGLQFHGNETPEFCHRWKLPWLKAVHVSGQNHLEPELARWSDAFACLLDTETPGVFGGSGQTFDWNLIPETWRSSIVLSGGLRPDNVADAIGRIAPYALDVSSGVEIRRGEKSRTLIEAFMKEVKSAGSGC